MQAEINVHRLLLLNVTKSKKQQQKLIETQNQFQKILGQEMCTEIYKRVGLGRRYYISMQ